MVMIVNSDLNSISSFTTQFAAMLDAAQVLAQPLKHDEVLRHLGQLGLQESGGDRCCLIVPDPDGIWTVVAIATPTTIDLCSIALESNNFDIPTPLIRYVINTQNPLVMNDGDNHLPILEGEALERQQYPASLICLPLVYQGQLLGVVYGCHDESSGGFSEEQVLRLKFLCSQGAIALDRAQLLKTIEQANERERTKTDQFEQTLSLLRFKNLKLAFRADIDASLTKSDDLRTMLQSCTEAVVDHLDAAFARIWTLDPSQNILELQASAGQYTHIDGDHSQVPVGKFKIGLIAQERLPHLTNDVVNDPRVGNKEWAKRERMVSFAGYPLIVEDELMGVVALFARRPLPNQLLEMLELVADEIALGISRKKVEQALQHSEAQLRQRQQELEEALQQIEQSQLQLVQNEKMASLGNLVAGVAHEVNNPVGFLNGSIANAEEYLQDLLDHLDLYQTHYTTPVEAIADHAEEVDLDFLYKDFPTLLGSMQRASNRIKNISNSLCTFSRADTDQRVSSNIHDGLDSTLLILKYRLKANRRRPAIQVVRKYGVMKSVDCFPAQINQVFMNVLANAIDMFDELAQSLSMDELNADPPTITIQTAMVNTLTESGTDGTEGKGQTRAEIRIRDNGKGMSQAIMTQVFDHLFTTKCVGKGTGLGLAIAYQIVTETHAGTLTVQSEVNQGTEFCIQLPLTA